MRQTYTKRKSHKVQTKNGSQIKVKSNSIPLQGSKDLQNLKVKWSHSGKPVIEKADGKTIEVSLSHDERVCLYVAGHELQGCDIAPITHRELKQWNALLKPTQVSLMQQLITSNIDSPDMAGTRIWAAREAFYKAINDKEIDLVIEANQGNSVLFRCRNQKRNLRVLTFPIKLTRGYQKIVAITVYPSKKALAYSSLSSSSGFANHEKLALLSTKVKEHNSVVVEHFDYDPSIYQICTAENNQKVLAISWPVSYKETSNPSQSVYFSNFFNWMGRVRDISILPIREPLSQLLAQGKFGMVTNYAQIKNLGRAGLNDIVKVMFWVTRKIESVNSTVDFHYDWQKMLPDGSYERIALGLLRMTWVQISQDGVAEPKPLPDFLNQFLERLCPSGYTPQILSEQFQELSLGKIVYQTPSTLINGFEIHQETFATTLEDTDAIGNINFANYGVLQGRIRDSFFQSLIPEYYVRASNKGEFQCLKSQVEYLREALPFEPIQVVMSLNKIYERGLELTFEYFKLMAKQERQKIAVGKQTIIWLSRQTEKANDSALLPEKLSKKLLDIVNINLS